MRTLGIFAKQPVPGHVKTRLAADWGNERATELYECFVRDLLSRFAGIGDRRIVGFAPDTRVAQRWFEETATSSAAPDRWTLWPQPDSDLGSRMAMFFETWTESPDHRTILIGSDSPAIPTDYLEQAWQLLDENDCVIGPATDGGYYLIGLQGSVTDFAAPFVDVEWSTSGVLLQTVAALSKHALSLGLLPPWYDVDSIDAVDTLTGHLAAFDYSSEEHDLQATRDWLAHD